MTSESKAIIIWGLVSSLLVAFISIGFEEWNEARAREYELRVEQQILAMKNDLFETMKGSIRKAEKAEIQAESVLEKAKKNAIIISEQKSYVDTIVDKIKVKANINEEDLADLMISKIDENPNIANKLRGFLSSKVKFKRILAIADINSPNHKGETKICPTNSTLINFGLAQHNAITQNNWNYCQCFPNKNGVQAAYYFDNRNPNGNCTCFGLCVEDTFGENVSKAIN